MLKRSLIAVFAGCFAIISMTPSIHAQTVGEYGGILGRTASGPKMPSIDPSTSIHISDHSSSSVHSSSSHSTHHDRVQSYDDDDNSKDSPSDRTADWDEVK